MSTILWRSKLPSLAPVASELDDSGAAEDPKVADVEELRVGSGQDWIWDDDNSAHVRSVAGQSFPSSQESQPTPSTDEYSAIPGPLLQTLKIPGSPSEAPPSTQTTQTRFDRNYVRERSLSPPRRRYLDDQNDFDKITSPMRSMSITVDDHDHVGPDFELAPSPTRRLPRPQPQTAKASVTSSLQSSSSRNSGYSQQPLTVPSSYNTFPEPPQTPAKQRSVQSSSSLIVLSTPGDRGSASAGKGQGLGDHRVNEIRGHFAMDVVRHSRVDFRVMLCHLLTRVAIKDTDSGQVILNHCLPIAIKICNDSRVDIEKLWKDYGKTSDEIKCYPYITGLSNLLLSHLKAHSKKFTKLRAPSSNSSLDIKYEINSSVRIKQTHADKNKTLRSLDIIAARKFNIERARKSDQVQVSLEWVEILQTWEIKRSLLLSFKKGKPFTAQYFARDPMTDVCHSFMRSAKTDKNSAAEILTQTKPKGTRTSSRLAAKAASIPSTSTSTTDSSSNLPPLSQESMYCDVEPKNPSQLMAEEDRVRQCVNRTNRTPPLVQMAIYAGEFLSRGPFTLHVINLLVVDELMWIWWYDRQNAIQTTAIDFFQSLPYLVCLLAAFQRFELRDWGIEPRLIHGGGLAAGTSDFDFTFKNGTVVTISPSEPIFSQLSLRGRATRVLNAMCPGDPSRKLAFKICWPEESRMNEALLIKLAISRLTKAGQAHLIAHLPEVLRFEDFDYSTGDINKALGITPDKSRGPRRLRAILFAYLESIETLLDLNDPAIIFQAWLDCFICHFNLWDKDIHHGDISLWNLMWNPEKKVGVLNDFDLIRAHNITEEELHMLGINGEHDPSGINGERTGTIPFMAIDLLTKEYFAGQLPRLYRHDAESFVWVLSWLCLHGVSDEQNARLATWKTGGYEQCKKERVNFLDESNEYQCRHGFDVLWDYVQELLDDIAVDRRKRKRSTFIEPSPSQVHDKILSQACNALPKEWNITTYLKLYSK